MNVFLLVVAPIAMTLLTGAVLIFDILTPHWPSRRRHQGEDPWS